MTISKKNDSNPSWAINNIRAYKTILSNPTIINGIRYDDAFCAIISRASAARMIWADDEFIVFFSQGNHAEVPSKHNHKDHSIVLVVPRQHIIDIIQYSAKELKTLFEECAKIARIFGNPNTYSIKVNRGSPLQAVPHLHAHLTIHHTPSLAMPLFKQTPYEIRSIGNTTNFHFQGYK